MATDLMEPTTNITRRRFMRDAAMGALALGTPAFLAACGKSAQKLPNTIGQLISERRSSGDKAGLQVFLAGDDFVTGEDAYVGFGLVDAGGTPVIGQVAKAWLANGTSGAPSGPLDATWYGYTKPDGPAPSPQGVNAFTTRFPAPGNYSLAVEVQAGSTRTIGEAALLVKDPSQSSVPQVGQRALSTLTPTIADHHGVDPICTRTPPCDMHQVTLAKALTLGKPIAFNIGTPRFCQSRTCGPNLEELITVERSIGARATFIHAEVYKDDKAQTIQRQITSPTFNEWKLQSEPWLFLIDGTGVIRQRLQGPLTASVIGPKLEELLK